MEVTPISPRGIAGFCQRHGKARDESNSDSSRLPGPSLNPAPAPFFYVWNCALVATIPPRGIAGFCQWHGRARDESQIDSSRLPGLSMNLAPVPFFYARAPNFRPNIDHSMERSVRLKRTKRMLRAYSGTTETLRIKMYLYSGIARRLRVNT